MSLRAIILDWLIGKLNAWAHPDQANEIAGYQANAKATEADEAARLAMIEANANQLLADAEQLVRDAEQVKENQDAITTLEQQRGERAEAARRADVDIDARGAGAIDRPLPGTTPGGGRSGN